MVMDKDNLFKKNLEKLDPIILKFEAIVLLGFFRKAQAKKGNSGCECDDCKEAMFDALKKLKQMKEK